MWNTGIIASTTQEYTRKPGFADIGGTVRTRAPFVAVGVLIAIVLFFLFGGSGGGALDPVHAEELLEQYQMPAGLLLLIPTAVVILLAVRGKNIFACLGVGIVIAVVIGLVAGLFDFSALVSIKDGAVTGAIPSGVGGMLDVSILLLLVVSMGELLIQSGCMDNTVNWLNESVIKTPRGADLAIFSLATVFGILIAAINTIANICVAPFVNAVGKKNRLHPYRRCNILATVICSFPFFVPFGGCVLLLLGGLSSMKDVYPFLPNLAATDMFFTTFYSWAIWVVMLVACVTGIGRRFEGKDGEPVKTQAEADKG